MRTQLTGHSCVLQVRVCDDTPQALPPCSAARSVERVRVAVPPAHFSVQAPQLIQADCSQSTGHASVAQFLDSLVDGQTLPPYAALVWMRLERLVVPVPQDTVHADHDCQEETTQLTGQKKVLHDCVAVSEPQVLPPWTGTT